MRITMLANDAPVVAEPMPTNVIEDYALASGTSYSIAESHARELEKFLFLCSRRKQSCIPSPVVDAFWHDFILHTEEYATFCIQNFGHFIHHRPNRGSREIPPDDYRKTVDALAKTFGPVNHEVWPRYKSTLRLICKD